MRREKIRYLGEERRLDENEARRNSWGKRGENSDWQFSPLPPSRDRQLGGQGVRDE